MRALLLATASVAVALAPVTRRDAFCGAAAFSAAVPALANAEADAPRSPRPLGWKILPGDPPLMQPYTDRGTESLLKEIGSNDVVLLGAKRRGKFKAYLLRAQHEAGVFLRTPLL